LLIAVSDGRQILRVSSMLYNFGGSAPSLRLPKIKHPAMSR
jgi:hypothetical protein